MPFICFAQTGGGEGPGAASSIQSIGVSIANAVWIIFTVVAVVSFLIAGILFLTSYGDPQKIKMAKDAALWGVAGVIVGLLAYSIITITTKTIF